MPITYHHAVSTNKDSYEWVEENVTPFEELIISWNALRPKVGYFHISISFKKSNWTPYVDYIVWSHEGQKSFDSKNHSIESYQDIVSVKEGKATGFKIRVESKGGAQLKYLFSLHACTGDKHYQVLPQTNLETVLPAPVPGLSQLALNHPRNRSICSPTSTTAVIRYLLKENYQPLEFASKVYDHGFDIYGNWVFNVAQASTHLGPSWHCWVARLHGMEDLIRRLKIGPLVVSVKGTFPGALIPYDSGHLIAVRGYDAEKQLVHCMDPAYFTDQETLVSYPLVSFKTAWENRKCLAYLFERRAKG